MIRKDMRTDSLCARACNFLDLQASEIISQLGAAFTQFSETEKKSQIKKVRRPFILAALVVISLTSCSFLQTNGIFELRIKNEKGEEAVWTIDLKKTGTVYKGNAKPKADVTIILSDETFVLLSEGKVNTSFLTFGRSMSLIYFAPKA